MLNHDIPCVDDHPKACGCFVCHCLRLQDMKSARKAASEKRVRTSRRA
jgi:hypothetical protein